MSTRYTPSVLAVYDQANANGILGITRARDAGFDLCHFNLYGTFSTPHGCGGPAAGASGVSTALVPFLPKPTVEFNGTSYYLKGDLPHSVGKICPWYGVAQNILKAYSWIMSLGAEGLREVAEIAVLNNNYLLNKVLAHMGVVFARVQLGATDFPLRPPIPPEEDPQDNQKPGSGAG